LEDEEVGEAEVWMWGGEGSDLTLKSK